MDKFKEHRRKITKSFFVRGYEKSAISENDNVKIPSSSGILKSLEISGKTFQEDGVSINTPKEIECTGRKGLSVLSRGVNLINQYEYRSKTVYGVTVESENNTYRINGAYTDDANSTIGTCYSVMDIKPNRVYTVRLSVVSGSFTGGSARVFYYLENPLTYISSLCNMWASKTTVVTGKKVFTKEEVERGIAIGVYFSVKQDTRYSDFVVKVDMVEGDYTDVDFPPFEVHVPTKSFTVNQMLNGIDSYNDELTLDFKNKIMKTTKRVKYVWIKDMNREDMEIDTQGPDNVVIIKNLSRQMEGTGSYCTHFLEYGKNNHLFPAYEFFNVDNGAVLYFYGVEQGSISEFLSFAEAEGMCIAYVLENEEKYEEPINLNNEILNIGNSTIVDVENSSGIKMVYYDTNDMPQ